MILDHHTFRAVAILGAPGAGKGTLARRLASECAMQHVDLGQLLRRRARVGDPVGRRIAHVQAQGKMVSKELVLEVLNRHLSTSNPARVLVLDGFPRTTAQLAAADDGRVPIQIGRALWLDVPRAVAESRLRTRAGVTPRNDDAAVNARFALTEDTVEAVRREFAARGTLEVVDATSSAEAVFAAARDLLDPVLAAADAASWSAV